MRVSKSRVSYKRSKCLLFGVLVTLFGIISFGIIEIPKAKWDGIPEFEMINNTPISSVIFKGHFLSVIKGVSQISRFSNFKERFKNSMMDTITGNDLEAKRLAYALISSMDLYEEHKSNPKSGFWNKLTKFCGIKDPQELFDFGNKPATGEQKAFWERVKKQKHAGVAIGKKSLFDAKDGGILHYTGNDQGVMNVALSFERERLESHLTAEDNLFIRVLEKKIILGNHKGFSEFIDSLKAMFNIRNDFDKGATVKDENGKAEPKKDGEVKPESSVEKTPETHNLFKFATETWNSNFHFTAHDPKGKEFDNGIPETDKPITNTEVKDTKPVEEEKKKSRSEIAKEEQAQREKEREERKEKRRAARAVWQTKEEEIRKNEEEELKKLDKGSEKYEELALKFKNNRKQRRVDLFNKLWNDEEVIAHPGYK